MAFLCLKQRKMVVNATVSRVWTSLEIMTTPAKSAYWSYFRASFSRVFSLWHKRCLYISYARKEYAHKPAFESQKQRKIVMNATGRRVLTSLVYDNSGKICLLELLSCGLIAGNFFLPSSTLEGGES